MPDHIHEKDPTKPSAVRKIVILAAVFVIIICSIFLLRSLPQKESEYTDPVAGQIRDEMDNNHWVISTGIARRTVADFYEPVISAHGKDSRLIVHTATLSETISVANEGLGGWKWTSVYQNIVYEGDAQYTVDLSRLGPDDFTVNNELKQLTVRIPYAVLDDINIPAEKIQFQDKEKGWLASKDIKLTPEQNTQISIEVGNRMKARLIDDNILAQANEDAKEAVYNLFSATVLSIDPEFTVVVVQ